MNVKRNLIVIGSLILLSGCQTPSTQLTNDKGDQVECGGSYVGSLAGGLIGYKIQEANDKECVAKYKEQGYEETK